MFTVFKINKVVTVLLFLLLILLFSFETFASHQFGLKMGANNSLIFSDSHEAQQFFPGFSGGVFFNKLGNISFGLDLIYNQYGCNELRQFGTGAFGNSGFVNGYYITRIHVISLPVYYIFNGTQNTFNGFELGFSNNLILKDIRSSQYASINLWGCTSSTYSLYSPSLFLGFLKTISNVYQQYNFIFEGRTTIDKLFMGSLYSDNLFTVDILIGLSKNN